MLVSHQAASPHFTTKLRPWLLIICFVCCAEWHMCVLCKLIVYFMGGQLVFDWYRLDNILISRDRPVGNKSQMQHAKVEYHMCKYSVLSPLMHRLPRNNRKTYSNTFAASAELAYGQPLQEAPKNAHDQPIDGKFLCTFWNIDWKCSFWVSCQFNAKSGAIDKVTLDDRPVDAIDLLATPGLFQRLSYISLGWNFEHSTSSFMQSTFAKRQFEFVVFLSYILLLYFKLWSTPRVTKSIFFISPTDWMLELFCH